MASPLPSLKEVKLGFSARYTPPFVSWSPISAAVVENVVVVIVLLYNFVLNLPGSPIQVFSALVALVSEHNHLCMGASEHTSSSSV